MPRGKKVSVAPLEGAKNDNGKVMWQLLPYDALRVIAEVFTHGAEKYGDRNWENGIKYGRVFGAIMRHLSAWAVGERIDPESGKSHLAHAGAGILFLLAYEQRTMDDAFDDLPKVV